MPLRPWMGAFIGLLLFCGCASAYSSLEKVDLVSARAGIEDTLELWPRRKLKAAASESAVDPSQPTYSDAFEVPVSSVAACYLFTATKDPLSSSPYNIYRQALQAAASAAAKFCGIDPPTSGKFLAKISARCKANRKTQQAESIDIAFETVVITLDVKQRGCFYSNIQATIGTEAWACGLNAQLAQAGEQVWAITGVECCD